MEEEFHVADVVHFCSLSLLSFFPSTATAVTTTMASLHFNNKTSADVELTATAGTSSPDETPMFDDNVSHVPEKYRGTPADKQDMAILGKEQVLRVGNPSDIAAVHVLTVLSEISVSLPCLASHLHVWPAGKAYFRTRHLLFACCFLSSDNYRYLIFSLINGGTALLFWGFIACAVGQSLVYASLAEMASM